MFNPILCAEFSGVAVAQYPIVFINDFQVKVEFKLADHFRKCFIIETDQPVFPKEMIEIAYRSPD